MAEGALERTGSKITKVLWDFGGVLCNLPDPQIARAMAEQLSIPVNKVEAAFGASFDDGMTGDISKKDYLSRFYRDLGVRRPRRFERAESYFHHPELYYPNSQIQKVVEAVAENPKVDQWVFTDCIEVFAPVVQEAIQKFHPKIDPLKVVFSYEAKASKRRGDGYKAALKRMQVNDASTVITVDDRQGYVDLAKSIGMHAIKAEDEQEFAEVEGRFRALGLI